MERKMLNVCTCIGKGLHSVPSIKVYDTRVKFSKAAEHMLALKEGDMVSFDATDGLRLVWDNKSGFVVVFKYFSDKSGGNYVIYNSALCRAIKKLTGHDTFYLDGMKDGGWMLSKLNYS